jgi:hypothetical protein
VVGGTRDTLALFRSLAQRVANPLDNGSVQGHVSTVDRAHFDEIEAQRHLKHEE